VAIDPELPATAAAGDQLLAHIGSPGTGHEAIDTPVRCLTTAHRALVPYERGFMLSSVERPPAKRASL